MMRTLAVIFIAIFCLMILIPFAGDIGRYLANWMRGQRKPVPPVPPEQPEAPSPPPDKKEAA